MGGEVEPLPGREGRFEQSDLVRRQIEKTVDDGVDLPFGVSDGCRKRASLRRVLSQIALPVVALADRDIGAEGAPDLCPEGIEIKLPPVVKPSGKVALKQSRPKIEDTMANRGVGI